MVRGENVIEWMRAKWICECKGMGVLERIRRAWCVITDRSTACSRKTRVAYSRVLQVSGDVHELSATTAKRSVSAHIKGFYGTQLLLRNQGDLNIRKWVIELDWGEI